MSNATCTQCGKEYRWNARRGSHLSDFLSPCCHVSGKAVSRGGTRTHDVRICPDCNKSGLWYRKAIIRADLYQERIDLFNRTELGAPSHNYAYMYCPRCKKWVKSVRKEN
jgi:uncharacterized protein YbaR (Trm112 family)